VRQQPHRTSAGDLQRQRVFVFDGIGNVLLARRRVLLEELNHEVENRDYLLRYRRWHHLGAEHQVNENRCRSQASDHR